MYKKTLSVKNLVKKFNNKNVIDDISFFVEKGKIFGLLGGNGAGKTTIINCIADLHNIDSGAIEVFEKDLCKETIEIKKKIGFLFENTESLFDYLKGEEQLEFVADVYQLPRKVRKERIEESLSFWGLEDAGSKLIAKYSKGMRKRLAMASTLIHNPDLIVLDEPFDGLDATTNIKVKKIIKQLKVKGKTILVTSHVLSFIEDLADEVAIINKGKIVYQSATKDIRNKIKNELTRETYNSLEEIFIDLTVEEEEKSNNTLSWL